MAEKKVSSFCNFSIIRALMASSMIVVILIKEVPVRAQMAPAMFVFGDSLADVGNNNHLKLSLAKADFPHNGIDFPTHKPTGRFSNGKNAADFLAEKLGLPTPPPYLSLLHSRSSNFLAGVSFASGGAGIFNGTDHLYRQSIPLSKQIEYYSVVRETMAKQLKETVAEKIQSKAIHAIVIGSNDILGYYGSHSNFSKHFTPEAFVALMVDTMTAQLKHIYSIGGRKFVMIGVGAVGCSPKQRSRSRTGECNEAANHMASEYNKGLQLALERLKSELQGFLYSYFDTYSVLLDFIQKPALYGFKEVKAACCGLGNLNAKFACLPVSSYCYNRSDHVFWDFYHPTESADRIVIDTAFDGTQDYAHPINIRQLVAV